MDMMNWAFDIDLYQQWAQIIAKGEVSKGNPPLPLYYTAYTSRKRRYQYKHSIEEGQSFFCSSVRCSCGERSHCSSDLPVRQQNPYGSRDASRLLARARRLLLHLPHENLRGDRRDAALHTGHRRDQIVRKIW